jgi:hypothetical protein
MTADLRALLLQTGGQMLAGGHLYRIKAKHLGAGVHEVRLKQWEG